MPKIRKIESDFWIDDEVYLVTDPDQNKWIILEVRINPNGLIYVIVRGTEEKECYSLELSDSVNPKSL